ANAFAFAGQSCISVQRIYVERSLYDAFVQAFLPKVEALKVGDPADDETDVGPVIDDDARTRIREWIEEAKRDGAQQLAGGVAGNEARTFRSDQRPYAGGKASGNTKEGPAYAVREMTEERLVVIQR